jgi:hypothetical protein
MTNLELVQYMNAQHPDYWDTGRWYPAQLPTGGNVEIKRTTGRGRLQGKRYLHVRYTVPLVIVDPDGKRTPMGITYAHTIHNLKTGEWREV